MIVVAGGAKTLASPRNDFEQDFILEQVRMSIRLHQTKRVLVMSHSDCATYGGLAQFKGDREAEALHHRARTFARGRTSHRKLRRYFGRTLLREVRRNLGSAGWGATEGTTRSGLPERRYTNLLKAYSPVMIIPAFRKPKADFSRVPSDN